MSETNNDLKKMRERLDNIINDYTKIVKELPLFKLKSAEYNLENMLTHLKEDEDLLRKSGEELNETFQTALKLLELRVNSNILHQHFIGCLNVATNCEDLMCVKIFMSQAFSTLCQMNSFLAKFLELYEEINVQEMIDQIKHFKDNKEIFIKYKSQTNIISETMEKMVEELNEKVSKLPSKLY